MKRRSFLKLISLAAAALALPKLLVEPEPVSSYSLPPRGTAFPAFDPDIHVVDHVGYECVSCEQWVASGVRGHALRGAKPGTFASLCRYADYSKKVDEARQIQFPMANGQDAWGLHISDARYDIGGLGPFFQL